MLSQLSGAAKMYELDHGGLPPGDGQNSAALMKCLRTPAAKQMPYFDFETDALSQDGSVRNPVDPDKIVHYRYPGVHNPKSFDLWCEDLKGRPDGINNWQK